MSSLSSPDRKILRLLQKDANLSRRELAERAGVSLSTLWRRMSEMEADGTIVRRVTLLDQDKVGLPVCVFLSVNLVSHTQDVRDAFESFVMNTPEIMQCYSVTGSFDHQLIIRTESVMTFETILMTRILRHPSVASASSQISLRQQKYSTELPI